VLPTDEAKGTAPVIDLYTDGGLLSNNPSLLGGTWAWVQVSAGCQVASGSGVVTCEEVGSERVTNNFTEMLAIVQGLNSMPNGWRGTLFTDSEVSRIRLVFPRAKWKGIPPSLQQALTDTRERLGDFTVTLLAGHPSRRQLAAGKRGDLPCSRWNKWCDDECKRLAKAWLEAKAIREFEERHQEVAK
jgi:ribonuclease HI